MQHRCCTGPIPGTSFRQRGREAPGRRSRTVDDRRRRRGDGHVARGRTAQQPLEQREVRVRSIGRKGRNDHTVQSPAAGFTMLAVSFAVAPPLLATTVPAALRPRTGRGRRRHRRRSRRTAKRVGRSGRNRHYLLERVWRGQAAGGVGRIVLHVTSGRRRGDETAGGRAERARVSGT